MAKTKTIKEAPSELLKLQGQLELMKQEREQAASTAQQAITIANSFASRLNTIEQASAPLKDKNIVGKVWWILLNLRTIVDFIKTVISQVKEWRQDMDNLSKPANNG